MAKTDTNKAAAAYTREQLAASKKYAGQRDLICALLANGESYTADEADALIDTYLKGEVS